MKIVINIDPKHAQNVREAIAWEHGYRTEIPNPESRPIPLTNKKGEVKNQAQIDAWKPNIPNPESKEEFVKSSLIGIIKEKTKRYLDQQNQHDLDIS